jgi:small subunit ribosomal protein S7
MSRKGTSKIRQVTPDLIFSNILVSKLINAAMKDGKKGAATRQVYDAIEILAKETKEDGIVVLEAAIENIKPKVEVRPRRIGGAVYQVPTPVRGFRQNSLALRWLINASRAKANKQFHSFAQKLASELLAAYKNEGAAIGKRLEVEKMADANKAFAHLRW